MRFFCRWLPSVDNLQIRADAQPITTHGRLRAGMYRIWVCGAPTYIRPAKSASPLSRTDVDNPRTLYETTRSFRHIVWRRNAR